MFVMSVLAGVTSHVFAALPEVDIASGSLYTGRANVHPNMVLSLSVEFPTVGLAYRGDNGTYNRTAEYIGYFNPSKCYVYVGGERNVTNGYFTIFKDTDAATHECDGASFSGNFMNWAAASAIDILRYALTGGDRVVDTSDTTILQRAYLKEDFYANATYFPRRTVTAVGNVSAPNRVTPFNVSTLYIVSCRNRVLFSDVIAKSGNCDKSAYDNLGNLAATDKRLGEYLVRVKVCDRTEGPARTDLCQQYGDNYKPTGEMQRHAGQIRFAAMGYLLDNSATRYGGVLRAPMKYVGPGKFEPPAFLQSDNDKSEWDPATGVFYNNPDSPEDRDSASINSGVINYLNKFGRGGVYKELDPVGELYYEAIRYLQGMQPTSEATAGMTIAMKDGFPVIDGWVDPIIASCQRNYIVAIADVNTHWDRYIPGNRRTTYNNGIDANDSARAIEAAVAGKAPELDVTVWTRKVGEMESDVGGHYTNPAPRQRIANLDIVDTGWSGHGTYYVAGLAYWANTNDIRLDKPIRVKTFAIDVDEGGNGLIDGNTRTIKPRDSQLYLAAKYGGFDDRNGDGNPFVTYAEDGKTAVTGTNAEWDPDGTGVPSNYFLAGQPRALIAAIRKVFANVASTSGTTAGVAASNTRITSDGAYVYQPGFNPSRWSGSLKRLRLIIDDTGVVRIAGTADWDAGEILTGTGKNEASPTPDARRIYTSQTKEDGILTTIEFKWDLLSKDQQSQLDASPSDGKSDGYGSRRVAYLRGVRALEKGKPNGIFRPRDRVLGDIINANPAYVAAPALNVRGDGYADFYDRYKNRQKAVYVGANDGMLHAFAAGDGSELFAYVPNVLLPKLNRLTSPDYLHQPYVDGGLTVNEAKVAGRWRTVLASAMGGGAQGVFALDVTDPSDFAGGLGVLWEFTDADDPDIGNVTGAPVIAKFKTGEVKGVAQYRYFAVVPSGLNNYKNDGKGRFDDAAPGVLFLLALDKPLGESWKEGLNYYKFKTPATDSSLANGLSIPALVAGIDGAVRYAYAGDLQGNLWRFDFTGAAPWTRALDAVPTPLFIAKDANDVRQPITVQPKVVFAPGGGYVVLFGTGKFVENSDTAPGSFKPQSFYAILDTTRDGDRVTGRDQLAARVAAKSAFTDTVTISGADFTYNAGEADKRGWYLDFTDAAKTGERDVTNPLVIYGRVFFNTLIPGSDPCGTGGGRSYELDVLTGLPVNGTTTGTLSTVGLLSSPVLFDAGDTVVGDRNAIGSRTAVKTYSVINFGTGGVKGTATPAQASSTQISLPAGRFSWREIVNWPELRRAAVKK
jgi:type IV pilus assembly protein PilY1